MAQKGFRYLVDAIETLRQHPGLPRKPLVLTFGDGGFIQEEMQAIKDRRLNEYFRFMPFAPNVAGTIKGLDVVAMPSLWEACPLQPMEALVCGRPLIGTDCIGLREVLRSTPARIVSPRDGAALARAIMDEMEHPSTLELSVFKKEAAVRFDVKRQSSELEKTCLALIEKKRGDCGEEIAH
jgi:glycosyltransferase involved in cell wall biosynthesis